MERIKIKVCVGTNCCFSGGERLLEILEDEEVIRNNCEIEGVKCIGKACADGKASPVVEIDGRLFTNSLPERILGEIERMKSEGESRA